MKKMVKGSSMLTAVSLSEMVMHFVRTKCIALFLGPAGTGFLAQLMIFFEMLRVWGDLGSRRGEVIKTSYFLAIIASGITGLGVTLFAPAISQSLYGTSAHSSFIIFCALLLPLASISTVTASIVKGNLEYASFAKYTFASYLMVMAITPFLVYFFHYWGAVVVQGLFFISPLANYLIFNSRNKFISFSKKINMEALKEQFSYRAIQVYQDSLSNFSKVLIAASIVKGLGLSVMGMYQVVLTFSTVYLFIPIQSMSGYPLPLIAAAENAKEITRAINESLRFLLFLLTPVVVIFMVLSGIFIRFFFSAEFLAASLPLQTQLLGTLLLLVAYPFTVALQARGHLKALFITATVTPVLYVTLAWLLFDFKQLVGVAIAFSISNLISLGMQYYLIRRSYGFHFFPKNQRLLIATSVWVVLAYCAGFMSWEFRLLSLLLSIPWFIFSSKQHEREFLLDKLNSLKNLRKILPLKNSLKPARP